MTLTKEEFSELKIKLEELGHPWVAEWNAYCDDSNEERHARGGFTPGPDEPSLQELEAISAKNKVEGKPQDMLPKSSPFPPAIDWRDVAKHNFVSGVKDQGNCGSCVAFATLAVVESRAKIVEKIPANEPLGDILPDLSEADLFFCNTVPTCKNGWNIFDALNYLQLDGVCPATCFRYTAIDQPCILCNSKPYQLTKIIWQ